MTSPIADPPPLIDQAWSFARAVATFFADGCCIVSRSQYERRLQICDACPSRADWKCGACGCIIPLKARGQSMQCPLGKWPSETTGTVG